MVMLDTVLAKFSITALAKLRNGTMSCDFYRIVLLQPPGITMEMEPLFMFGKKTNLIQYEYGFECEKCGDAHC